MCANWWVSDLLDRNVSFRCGQAVADDALRSFTKVNVAVTQCEILGSTSMHSCNYYVKSLKDTHRHKSKSCLYTECLISHQHVIFLDDICWCANVSTLLILTGIMQHGQISIVKWKSILLPYCSGVKVINSGVWTVSFTIRDTNMLQPSVELSLYLWRSVGQRNSSCLQFQALQLNGCSHSHTRT